MKAIPFLTAAACLAALPAYALEQPVPGKADSRVRYVDYDPRNVVEIWSAPGAVMSIVFADDEQVVEVADPDSKTIDAKPAGNELFVKFRGCAIPEPMLVRNKTPTGSRLYNFQIETIPPICTTPSTVATPAPSSVPGVTEASAADPPPPPRGNLKLVAQTNALAAGSQNLYSVVFRYPGDEAAKRRAAWLARRAAWKKQEAERILAAATQGDPSDPFTGQHNLHYSFRGDKNLWPRWVFDNGSMTTFVFPNEQRMPSLYYIAPDGKESTASYSVHGNDVLATGTAQQWVLRDGNTVAAVWDLDYSPIGSTPGTGTISPEVQRVLKGAPDDR